MQVHSLASTIAFGPPPTISRGGPARSAESTPDGTPSEPQRSTESSTSRFDTKDEVVLSAQAQREAPGQLTAEEQRVVQQLRQQDREVRAHEQAHLAAAGPYAKGGPTYQYQQGPDGRQYAVGGEVSIDTAPVSGDPAATIRKAQVIRAAANAPAEPSAQDRRVAAAAAKMEAAARQELRAEQQAQQSDEFETAEPSSAQASEVQEVTI